MTDGFAITSIELGNFGPHEKYTWRPGGQFTVVTGPNGAGKSSVYVDAVLFALFGDVPDGSPPDELVRIGSSDMSVTLELTLDGVAYRFIRRRTTRAGGKSSADVQEQAPDGSWKPLAEGAREVTAEAIRLVRMDPSTFRMVVVIAQRDARRFLDATPGKGTPTAPGRAAVLSTLVVDPAFAKVEARSREDARDLEAATNADRSSIERLVDAIAELESSRDLAARRTSEVHEVAQAQTAAAAERDRIQARLTELAAEIATGDAAAAEVTRLEAERADLLERHKRAKATIVTNEATAIQAEAVIADAGDVSEAVGRLDDALAEVEVLVAGEIADRQLGIDIAERRKVFDPAETAHRELLVAWQADLRHAQDRVAELIVAVNALEPVVCSKCGTANVVDQAGLTPQLVAARARAEDLALVKPEETMAHSRERVAIKRLEERRSEAAWDPEPLRLARARLADTERLAARAGEISAARAALHTAAAAKASAAAELASIATAGEAVAARLVTAREATAGTAALVGERDGLEGELTPVARRIEELQRQRSDAERGLAQAEAQVDRLDQLTAERDALTAKLAGADVDLARLRRVVADAGVRGIPARVVESVLPELVAHANEFLGQLRPGMTLDLRATRAKADGSGTIEALDIWLTDSKGERQRMSGGEGTSIALSIAVALSRLGARRSGARVATQVIDEPDGLDSDSRRALGQAVRTLAHRGDLEVVVVITHQDGIPDFADDVVEFESVAEPSALDDVA